MDELTMRLEQGGSCNGAHCADRHIPKGAGFVVDENGGMLCLPCAEGPTLDTLKAGSLA